MSGLRNALLYENTAADLAATASIITSVSADLSSADSGQLAADVNAVLTVNASLTVSFAAPSTTAPVMIVIT